MKNLYGLRLENENGVDLTFICSNEVFTTMKKAARYGERLHRIHGWFYRIDTVYVNLIEDF